jgi:Leucine-rich repeat (LRR) protein
MKKLLLVLLALPFIGFGQQTYVPDDNFEQRLINLGYDNVLDDYVTTANINTVTYLNVRSQNIADLTGIEAFTALTYLWCYDNQLTSLNVSQNTALNYLDCANNQLTSLNLSQNTALTTLWCSYNQLNSLDVSQNTALTELYCYSNQLSSLYVSQNTALIRLDCGYNQLTSLNVSQNTALTELWCYNNQLTSLDVRNGNNTNFIGFLDAIGNATPPFSVFNNPNLTCINVDDAAWSTANWTVANYSIDSQSYFSNNCGSK